MRRADGPSMHTDDRTRQRCYSPGFCTLGEEVKELEESLHAADEAADRLREQVTALENAGMETASRLGEAEQRIAVAMNYLTDETRDRITRIRLAQLALEDKPDEHDAAQDRRAWEAGRWGA